MNPARRPRRHPETVDPGCFIGVTPVKRKPVSPSPATARMMLFDSNIPVLPSGPNAAGTLPNGCASRKRGSLEELRAGHPDPPVREWMKGNPVRRAGDAVIIPQPVPQLLAGRAPDLDVDAAEPSGDGRLPDARVGQVRKYCASQPSWFAPGESYYPQDDTALRPSEPDALLHFSHDSVSFIEPSYMPFEGSVPGTSSWPGIVASNSRVSAPEPATGCHRSWNALSITSPIGCHV